MKKNTEKRHQFTLLDGGMGRELLKKGAPFRQPEWSALALMEAPALVKTVHESYARAGSDILTTSNYAVVPFHLGEERFISEGAALTARAGQLAREAALPSGCRVAGSIPPLFGSYRPDLFNADLAPPFLKNIIDALSPYADLWLAETIGSISEVRAVAVALAGDKRPFWIAFTLLDGEDAETGPPRLRSGEKVTSALQAALELSASAILFNCSQPEVMAPAIETARQEQERLNVHLPIGVYANAFQPQPKDVLANSEITEIRTDLDPGGYLNFVDTWCTLGATIIGGCCGIGPEHIEALHQRLQRHHPSRRTDE